MNDREKIISAIEKAKKGSAEYGLDQIIVPFKAADMIIALLKEQEAVKPKHNPLSPTNWFCGKCGMCISRFHDYCPSCGREVKWDEQEECK